MTNDYLFVYGTLRRALAHPMYRVLAAGAEFVGTCTCPGRLFDLGFYPGARFDAGAESEIIGELHRLIDAQSLLAVLDRYEGCSPECPTPHEYERKQVIVRVPGGRTCPAWSYAFTGDASLSIRIIDGDYLAHCRWRVREVATGPSAPSDHAATDRVTSAAFGRELEAQLIRALRSADGFDPRLSLVAEHDGNVVGHILFSPMHIENSDRSQPALALSVLSVLPTHQRQGIGSRLVRVGLRICREAGHRIVIVVGHAEYYPRFGFVPARQHGIEAPFAVPDEAFMVHALTPNALAATVGTVRYPPAFDVVA
jgi:putative acetyltransferase